MSSEIKNDDKKSIENLMNISYSYPDPSDPELQKKIYEKREYTLHRYDDRPEFNEYADIKEYRDNICARSFTLHDHQAMLSNFINPDTPYKGVVVFHGLGSGKCQSANTRMYINGNMIKASDIWNKNHTLIIKDNEGGEWSIPKEELRVNSYDDKTNKIIVENVKHLYREKVKTKLREITLDNGSQIEITYQHKLLTTNGFTNNLKVNDYICVPNVLYNFPEINKLKVTNELAYLMGFHVCTENKEKNTIKANYDINMSELTKKIRQIGKDYNLKIKNIIINKNQIIIRSEDYVNFLKDNKYESQIPSFIMNSNKDQLKIFLRSYFNQVGYLNKKTNQIEIITLSKEIIEQISVLLKIFNIYLKYENKCNYYYGYINTYIYIYAICFHIIPIIYIIMIMIIYIVIFMIMFMIMIKT